MSVERGRRRLGSSGGIGAALDRVEGRLKVTGAATYAAEYPQPGLVHAVLVDSAVANGRIRQIDCAAAEASPGVLLVLTHRNAPRLPRLGSFASGEGVTLTADQPLPDDRVIFAGQHVALVVAGTLEQARHAAELVQVEYDRQPPLVGVSAHLDQAYPAGTLFGMPLDSIRGEPGPAPAAAEVRLEQTYRTPVEHHNPMEPPATIAVWDADGGLTVYESTQWVQGVKLGLAQSLDLPPERVRVISRYIGGGFGSKGPYWPHTTLAAIAARQIGRPVKLVLTRAQMYTATGYRPSTTQQVALGARRDGTLTSITHQTVAETSEAGEYTEAAGLLTSGLYSCPNVEIRHRLVRLNVAVPCFMRAPGEAPGSFAVESAMDELACELRLDPIELRLRNHADVDPESGRPWSSKSLKECYALGAERFGWRRRTPAPGSMRDGGTLIGWGMAGAAFPVVSFPGATASARIEADGQAVVRTSAHDLGTGAYTIMTQIAAEALGLPPERVRVELGDSDLPSAPVAGGSSTTASVGPAVSGAAASARDRVIELALGDEESPIHGYGPEAVAVEDGRLFLRHDPTHGETYSDVIRRHGGQSIEASGVSEPHPEAQRFAMRAFGAHFVEVAVDPDLGLVRVRRVVSAMGAGRIINPKTARSQIVGGVVWGIGMALLEQTALHPTLGKIVSPNLSGYLVPVHADVPPIEVYFVDEHDPYVNPLGAKGVGEIGIVGMAAAIANAVFHATGKRLRDLPITPDKLI